MGSGHQEAPHLENHLSKGPNRLKLVEQAASSDGDSAPVWNRALILAADALIRWAKKMLRKLRTHKGWLAALLVLLPYAVGTVKFTFYYNGCMDGFGIFWVSVLMIVFIGGPLSLAACLTIVLDRRALHAEMSIAERRIFWIGHALAALAVVIAVWVALAVSAGKIPFQLHSG